MENELEPEIESELPTLRRTTHHIDEIGSIKATNGTALETIAGAANYWQTRAKELMKGNSEEVIRVSKLRWKDGFLTGSLVTAIVTFTFIVCYRIFT